MHMQLPRPARLMQVRHRKSSPEVLVLVFHHSKRPPALTIATSATIPTSTTSSSVLTICRSGKASLSDDREKRFTRRLFATLRMRYPHTNCSNKYDMCRFRRGVPGIPGAMGGWKRLNILATCCRNTISKTRVKHASIEKSVLCRVPI
jgi:hypothetical protein